MTRPCPCHYSLPLGAQLHEGLYTPEPAVHFICLLTLCKAVTVDMLCPSCPNKLITNSHAAQYRLYYSLCTKLNRRRCNGTIVSSGRGMHSLFQNRAHHCWTAPDSTTAAASLDQGPACALHPLSPPCCCPPPPPPHDAPGSPAPTPAPTAPCCAPGAVPAQAGNRTETGQQLVEYSGLR